MKNNKSISIGISAYNEEKNIQNILKDVLKQEKNDWTLKEIIVICDGCTDKTAYNAKKIKNKKIKVIDNKIRIGKTQRLNEIFKIFKGDVLVMLDGDIKLSNRKVISSLILPFDNKNTKLVGGNSKPFSPQNFVQKAVYSTFSVFYESRIKINDGNNIFGSTGSILAIKKELAKKILLPKIVNEDAFIYLYCIKNGYKFKYVDNAVVYYKLPSNFTDYIRQLFRSNPESVESELKKYFGKLVKNEFERPFIFYFQSIFKTFLKNPFGTITIILINFLCRPLQGIVVSNYKLEWFTAKSTKK